MAFSPADGFLLARLYLLRPACGRQSRMILLFKKKPTPGKPEFGYKPAG